MVKFVLTGTDNDGFRHRYSIKKNEKFKEAFRNFMDDLEFNGERIIEKTFVYYDRGKDDMDVKIELKVADFEDCIRHYQNKKYDVDVFFGKAKIIIVVRTKGRIPMVKHLEDKSDWIKATEIKKIFKMNQKNKKQIPLQKNE